MTEQELFRIRNALVQTFLRDNGYDGILLSRVDNFAMATGGKRNYVGTFTDIGASSLFVTRDGRACFVGNNIESHRVMDEELAGLGCESRDFLWFDGQAASCVRREFRGTFVSDDGSLGENVNGRLSYLRALLTPFELEKYRELGRRAADAMMATLGTIRTGQTEAEIAATLAIEGAKRQCFTPVILIAADDRIARYRHPLPTAAALLEAGSKPETRVQRYVMVVGGFAKEGLVVSMTRFKQVDTLPHSIEDAHARICGVDTLMQEASEPGRTLGDVFAACQEAYTTLGFPPDEWHNHHQGGTTGYAGRTCKGAPGESFPIMDRQWRRKVSEILGESVEFGHAFAWNPSAPGVKSEDTFVLWPDGKKEIVSATPGLPSVDLARVLKRESEVVKSAMANA